MGNQMLSLFHHYYKHLNLNMLQYICSRKKGYKKRYKKFVTFFDILTGHAHNNIQFINMDGVKNMTDIQRHIVLYEDLIASM